jgi:hypothetical protein
LPPYLRITPIPDSERQPAGVPSNGSGPYLGPGGVGGSTMPADRSTGRVTSIVRPLGNATPRVAQTVATSNAREQAGNLRQTSTGRWVDDSGWTAGK